MGVHQVALREKDLAIVDLRSKLEESSATRETDEKLTKLQANLDQELVILQGREKELARLQEELEEKTVESLR